jgi:protein arginine N-methyltransferase 5
MASWCQPAPVSTVITSDEIATLSAEGNSTETTPVLKLIADARSRGYDSVCVPLTTGAWKDRWAETCILPPDYERSADMSADYRAELWRSNPTFDLGEVAMTRLGVRFLIV